MTKTMLPYLQGSSAEHRPVALDDGAEKNRRAARVGQPDPAQSSPIQNAMPEEGGGNVMNALKQTGRVFGGVAQGALKTVFAPGMLKEAADQRKADKLQAKTGDNPVFHQTDDTYTRTFNGANTAVENWSNSWIPEPQTGAAEVVAKLSDIVGEAIPAIGISALTGGSSVFSGSTLGHAAGAAAAVSSELAEGSGDPGKAVMRGATAWASEALGGATIDKFAEGIASPLLSFGVSALGEGAEEIADGLMYSGLSGDSYTLKDAATDFAYGALAGAALGGMANVGSIDSTLSNITKGGQISAVEIVSKGGSNKAKPAGKIFNATNPGAKNIWNSIGAASSDTTSQTTGENPSPHIPVKHSPTSSVKPEITGSASSGIGDSAAPSIGDSALPSIGGTQSTSTQALEVGHTEIQGNAVPSTPDTEPWKFPDQDPEPNTIPFPSPAQPDPDVQPDTQPATDPKIIPFPAQPEPEPNTIPFPTPAQPEPDAPPATDPQIIPFPSEPEPDTKPAVQPFETPDADPGTQPGPEPKTQPETKPNADPDAQPDAQPDTQPEIDPKPKTQPETQPKTQPDAKPDTQPQTQPDTTPKTKPKARPKTEPNVQPDAKPETQPNAQPDVQPYAATQTQTQTQAETDAQLEQEVQSDVQAESSLQLQTEIQSQTDVLVEEDEKRERRHERANSMIYSGSGAVGQVYESESYSSVFGGLSSY